MDSTSQPIMLYMINAEIKWYTSVPNTSLVHISNPPSRSNTLIPNIIKQSRLPPRPLHLNTCVHQTPTRFANRLITSRKPLVDHQGLSHFQAHLTNGGWSINCIYVFLQLQISFCVLRLAFHNALFYESPAEYQPLRSFFWNGVKRCLKSRSL